MGNGRSRGGFLFVMNFRKIWQTIRKELRLKLSPFSESCEFYIRIVGLAV